VVGRTLETSLAEPEFCLTDPSARPVVGAEIHVFRNGKVRMVALRSNPHLSLPELNPSDLVSNRRFEISRPVVQTLPGERFVYGVRAARCIGKQKQLTVKLDPYEPTILSMSSAAILSLAISGQRPLRAGETGTFHPGSRPAVSCRSPCLSSGRGRSLWEDPPTLFR